MEQTGNRQRRQETGREQVGNRQETGREQAGTGREQAMKTGNRKER